MPYLNQFNCHLCESHVSRHRAGNQSSFREGQHMCVYLCPCKNLCQTQRSKGKAWHHSWHNTQFISLSRSLPRKNLRFIIVMANLSANVSWRTCGLKDKCNAEGISQESTVCINRPILWPRLPLKKQRPEPYKQTQLFQLAQQSPTHYVAI